MKSFKNLILRVTKLSLVGLMLLSSSAGLLSARVNAEVTNPAPTAKVSFTFDDGYTSAFTQAAPTLAKYGLSGTNYVTTGCVGMTKAPNTCRADTDGTYLTWDQLSRLRNTYGWEIGSHTQSHPYLASSDAGDGQPNVLTTEQVVKELTQSKADLAAKGFNATSFASPYGDYNPAVLAEVAKLYTSHRGFADQNNNIWPNNDYLLNNMQVQQGVSVAQVKAKIDAAIADKHWLVLTFHDIKVRPSTNPGNYQYSTANLNQIASYVKAKQTANLLKSVNVSNGLANGSPNLLSNGSFDSGISKGWSTDSPTTITHDSGNNGSQPSSTNSVRLVSGQTNGHLFSPKVSVNADGSYLLKSFLSMQAVTLGSVAFYIDEYDINDNWVSGQYKSAENSRYVESMNFTYNPSSAQVSAASLQVIAQGTGVQAYLDNVQWLTIQAGTSTVVPAPVNLMPNHNFDAGITDGWITDLPTSIFADNTNSGGPNNPINSAKLASGTKHAHLFSPKIPVSPTRVYSLSTYLSLKSISTGEVGFYIDEYDINGNWVSGQYKLGVSAISAGDVNFSYQPTSAAVASSSLQVILVSNSNTSAFVDDIRWY